MSNTMKLEVSSVGRTVCAICLGVGGAVSAVLKHPAPMIAGALVGVYFLAPFLKATSWSTRVKIPSSTKNSPLSFIR